MPWVTIAPPARFRLRREVLNLAHALRAQQRQDLLVVATVRGGLSREIEIPLERDRDANRHYQGDRVHELPAVLKEQNYLRVQVHFLHSSIAVALFTGLRADLSCQIS
jgi:hypothetical protein